MKLLKTAQLTPADLGSSTIEDFVASSGFESRAPFAAGRLVERLQCKNRDVFGFADRKVLSRGRNDEHFRTLGFSLHDDQPSDDGTAIGEFFKHRIQRINGSELSIIVDYSCMPKTWYAEIIRVLFAAQQLNQTVHLYFVYSPAKFSPPLGPAVNRFAGAISGFCNLNAPSLPTALIVGLGYESVRALGLRDFLDPKVTFAFYTDPALQPEYVERVIRNNKGLLATLGAECIFPYPFADLGYTNALLTNLAEGLLSRFRVVVAPLGPKPFCLLSLILGGQTQSIDVWRVSAGSHGDAEEREPAGEILIYKTTFVD